MTVPPTEFLGIGLEIIAACLGTTSKQLIACTEKNDINSFSRRIVLLLGITLNVLIGPLVDASAYAFAPQTVVAPFASLDVLLNAFTAPFTLRFQRERFTWMHVAAALFVTGGASSAAVFGYHGNSTLSENELIEQLTRWQSLLYFAVEIVVIGFALVLLRSGEGRLKGLILGGVAGLLMGNVFLVKGLVGLIKEAIEGNDWAAFRTFIPYLLLVGVLASSIVGTFFMQSGLRKYKGIYMVTVFEGSHISTACLSGSVVMGEMSSSTWRQWFMYWASVACILSGIALINWISNDVEMTISSRSLIGSPSSIISSASHINFIDGITDDLSPIVNSSANSSIVNSSVSIAPAEASDHSTSAFSEANVEDVEHHRDSK